MARIICTAVAYLGLLGWLTVPWCIVEALALRRERRVLRGATVEMLRRLRAMPAALAVEAREVGEQRQDNERDERL